jgi:hypothetical protein
MGIALTNAYAILSTLIVEKDNSVRAIFSIQASRERTKNYQPIDKVEVRFEWDRKSNPVEMAYAKAKEQVIVEEVYEENAFEPTHITKYGLLYGWQDDITS